MFAVRELRIREARMKPQDILVLFKLLISGGRKIPYSEYAKDIYLSTSELHASIKRLEKNGLFSSDMNIVVVPFVKEFLFHGAKYVFPPELGVKTRGIPTSYGAKPLKKELLQPDEEIPVWPDPEGTHKGVSFLPIYKSAPKAAKKDAKLYRLLTLFDAIRSERARIRKIAEELMDTEISRYE